MRRSAAVACVFGALIVLALVATALLVKDPSATTKKTTRKAVAFSPAERSSIGEFPHMPWSAWGKQMADTTTAAEAAGALLRIPKNPFADGQHKPTIYVESGADESGRHAYAVIYPNGLRMIAEPEKPNLTLDFKASVRETSTAVPADRRKKLITIHGQKALGLEKGFNVFEEEEGEVPRPAVAIIYEGGIRYTFYAPLGTALADLIPLVEATK